MSGRDIHKLSGPWCVPDLSPHSLVAIWQLNSLEFKFYAICIFRFLFKYAFSNSKHQIGLANLFISDDNNFIEEIEIFIWIIEDFGSFFAHLLHFDKAWSWSDTYIIYLISWLFFTIFLLLLVLLRWYLFEFFF